MGLETAQLKKFVELRNRHKELKAELDAIENEIDLIESPLIEHMVAEGVPRLSIGSHTIYVRTDTWAGVDRKDGEATDDAYERANSALVASGHESLIKSRFLPQSLTAVVREMRNSGEEFPAEWQGAIRITDKKSLRVRRG